MDVYMYVYVYSMFVLSYVGRGLGDELITHPRSSTVCV
jgi:hypothetical protein